MKRGYSSIDENAMYLHMAVRLKLREIISNDDRKHTA